MPNIRGLGVAHSRTELHGWLIPNWLENVGLENIALSVHACRRVEQMQQETASLRATVMRVMRTAHAQSHAKEEKDQRERLLTGANAVSWRIRPLLPCVVSMYASVGTEHPSGLPQSCST